MCTRKLLKTEDSACVRRLLSSEDGSFSTGENAHRHVGLEALGHVQLILMSPSPYVLTPGKFEIAMLFQVDE